MVISNRDRRETIISRCCLQGTSVFNCTQPTSVQVKCLESFPIETCTHFGSKCTLIGSCTHLFMIEGKLNTKL